MASGQVVKLSGDLREGQLRVHGLLGVLLDVLDGLLGILAEGRITSRNVQPTASARFRVGQQLFT